MVVARLHVAACTQEGISRTVLGENSLGDGSDGHVAGV
jgi:hypothetical protein